MTFTARTTTLGLRLLLSPKVPLLLLTTKSVPPLHIKYFTSCYTIKGKKAHSMTAISLHSPSARLAMSLWAPIAVSRHTGEIQA